MALENQFGALALDATLAAVRDRIPSALSGDGGLITHIANTIDIADRSGRIVGHVTVDNASLTADVADRAARLLGHVTVDNFPSSQAVTGTVGVNNFPATQPVSDGGGSLTVDGSVNVGNFPGTQVVDSELTVADFDSGAGTDNRATVGVVVPGSGGASVIDPRDTLDRTGRLLGHVTVDNPTTNPETGLAKDATVAQLGAAADADASGNGTLTAIIKRIRTLFGGGLPSALVSDRLKVDGSGVTQPVSGPLTDTQLRATALAVDSELTTSDMDTGAGTDTRAVVGMVAPASGGGVLVDPRDMTDRTARAVGVVSGGTNVFHVDDNAASLTVDGTVGVNNFPAVQPVSDNAGSLTVDNGGTFVVQDSEKVADNAGFTDGTTRVLPAGFILDEVAGTALTENDTGAARIDSKRSQVGVIEDATTRGQRATVSAAGALKTDSSAVTQPVSGAVTANAGTGPFPVSDNAGSLTVDAPVATPIAVRQSDGAAFFDPRDVSDRTARVLGRTFLRNPGDTANMGDLTTPMVVNDQPTTTGGLSIQKIISAATTNATLVKSSAGQVYVIVATNINAAVRYLKLYNKATAPTVGTDTPVMTIPIPGNTAGAGIIVPIESGLAFATGIGLAITAVVTDADATAVALNEIVISLLYK